MFSFFPLQRHIYGHQGKNIQIFADNSSFAVNPSYVRSWLDLLSKTPRVAPFLAKNEPFVMALKKVCFILLSSTCFARFYLPLFLAIAADQYVVIMSTIYHIYNNTETEGLLYFAAFFRVLCGTYWALLPMLLCDSRT